LKKANELLTYAVMLVRS